MAGTAPIRHKSIVLARHILTVLARQGVSKDKVTFCNFERALRQYREAHPNAVFERELRVTLAYGDFALRNQALFKDQWGKAVLLAVDPERWQEIAAKFDLLLIRQSRGTSLGLYKEPLQLYGNHLTCCWDSAGDKEIGLRFDVLAAEAGVFLGSAPGVLEAIQQTDAESWADFWKYCLWFHLGLTDSVVAEPITESMKLCLNLALRCSAIRKHSDPLPKVLPQENSEILGAIPPRRVPDLQTSRARIQLAVALASELALIKQETKGYSTVDGLKLKYPNFKLWNYIKNAQIKELVEGEEFAPKAYAESLVLIKYGLTSRETLKKDRQKIRNADKRPVR